MKNLWILVGCPASGKSTWTKRLKGSVTIVSRDDIRFNLVKENEYYFSKEKQVFNKFINDAEAAFNAGVQNVVLDATHVSVASRRKTLNTIAARNIKANIIAVYFETTVDGCLKRNELRAGTRSFVPESAIRNMHSQLTKPTLDEGFNHIIIERIDN